MRTNSFSLSKFTSSPYRVICFLGQKSLHAYGVILGILLGTSPVFSIPNNSAEEKVLPFVPRESLELQRLRTQAEEQAREQAQQHQRASIAREQELDQLNAPSWMKPLAQSNMPPAEEFRFYPAVVEYLRFYKETPRGRHVLTEWLTKQGRYQALVQEILSRYNLPPFLLAVAAVESTFDPQEGSAHPERAVGLWQLLPINAQTYQLRVDFWVDERQDPVRSTEATARYLSDLKEQFGTWELAWAAFHAGQGAVLNAIKANHSNDFGYLSKIENGLPYTTTQYVPKVLAAALALNHADLLDQPNVSAEPPLAYDEVVLSSSLQLRTLAKVLGRTEESISQLNPHLLRRRTPPLTLDETFVLRVPKGLPPSTLEQVRHLQEKNRTYTLRPGESPQHIAKKFGLSLYSLAKWNGFALGVVPPPGTTLFLPPSAHVVNTILSEEEPLVLVAVPNKQMVVPNRKRIFYQTLAGDTLERIAQVFQNKPEQIAAWNLLDPRATLPSDLVLDLWVPPTFDTRTVRLVHPSRVLLVSAGSEEFLNAREILRGRTRASYTCQSGDTWDTVASHLGITISNLQRINGLDRKNPLQIGQSLLFYRVLRPEEQEQALHALKAGGFPPGIIARNKGEDDIDAYAWIPTETVSPKESLSPDKGPNPKPEKDTSAHAALTIAQTGEHPH